MLIRTLYTYILSLSILFLKIFYYKGLTNPIIRCILIPILKRKGCISIETHERVRQVRKHFKLSQEEFGKRLGVSRSVIKNIELNLLAKPEQKLSLLKLICSQFGVSEDWLIDGIGNMFDETKDLYIEKLVRQYSLDDMDRKILKAYVDLPSEQRAFIKEYLKTFTSMLNDDKKSDDTDIEKELEIYRKELEIEKRAKAKSSASDYTREEKDA